MPNLQRSPLPSCTGADHPHQCWNGGWFTLGLIWAFEPLIPELSSQWLQMYLGSDVLSHLERCGGPLLAFHNGGGCGPSLCLTFTSCPDLNLASWIKVKHLNPCTFPLAVLHHTLLKYILTLFPLNIMGRLCYFQLTSASSFFKES